jgi:hypothetical protein
LTDSKTLLLINRVGVEKLFSGNFTNEIRS